MSQHLHSYLPGHMQGLVRVGTCLLVAALLFAWQAQSFAAPPELKLTPAQARAIGERVWQNEGAGKVENLTVWNKGEDFPSFGIGHFIWYPAGVEGPFTESFPLLLEHLKHTTTLPAWLAQSRHAPWHSRDEFYAAIDSAEMNQLRQLLQLTIPQQVGFIVQRMEAALPKMLAALTDKSERSHVQQRFYRVARSPNGIYALIDYVNFKGEGTSEKERYRGQGWGLLQVLQNMRNDRPAMQAFVNAADLVLTRRVRNAPRDESRWLPGWRKRLQTYL
jgi:hypothetical protein